MSKAHPLVPTGGKTEPRGCDNCGVVHYVHRGSPNPKDGSFCSTACRRQCRASQCARCESLFIPWRSTQRYCSHVCMNAARAMPLMQCRRCGTEFESSINNRTCRRKEFCGSECRNESKRDCGRIRRWMKRQQKKRKRHRGWWGVMLRLAKPPKAQSEQEQWWERVHSMAYSNAHRRLQGKPDSKVTNSGGPTWGEVAAKMVIVKKGICQWQAKVNNMCSNQRKRMDRKARRRRCQAKG